MVDITAVVAAAFTTPSHRFEHVAERHDLEVCEEIDRWWQAAHAEFDKNEQGTDIACAISGTKIDGSARGLNSLERDEYELFYARLGKILFSTNTCTRK